MIFKITRNRAILLVLICLVAIDMVTSKKFSIRANPVADAYVFESGSDAVDGFSVEPARARVSIVSSGYSGLSFSKGATATLTPAEVREMVFTAILLDKHPGTQIPELKYKIDAKGPDCRVSLYPNLVYCPGQKYMPGDETDPRIIWAVLDYIADSTTARRISLLAGGSYLTYSADSLIFTMSLFGGSYRWNTYYAGLPDGFRLKDMLDSARARHPEKTIEGINLNYNEIMTGGKPYNELTPAERVGKTLQFDSVPLGAHNIKELATANTMSEGGRYNTTDGIRNCDILVNMPVIKVVPGLGLSGVFKAYIGSVSRASYNSGPSSYPGDRGASLNALDHNYIPTLLNLFSFHPTDYVVADGTAGLEGDGPHPYKIGVGFFRRNLVMAGGDPVATEAVMAASLNLNPNDLDILRYGAAKGFGCFALNRVELLGTPLADVRMDAMAWGVSRNCRRWLLNGPYSAADNRTEHINEPAADPRPGDQENGNPWTEYVSPADAVNLATAVGSATTNSVVYAFTQIYSDKAQTGLLNIGGTRDIRVYVNGVKIIDSAFTAYSNPNASLPVSLVQGDNRILVKVRRSAATSAYSFSIAVVNNGSLSTRATYVPYLAGNLLLGSATAISASQKQYYFGGRTLFGTFYHLGQSQPGAIESSNLKTARRPSLLQNEPNPFTGATRIRFSLPGRDAIGELSVYDLAGKKIITLFSGRSAEGARIITWNGRNSLGRSVSSGVYLCRLQAGGTVLSQRMMVLR